MCFVFIELFLHFSALKQENSARLFNLRQCEKKVYIYEYTRAYTWLFIQRYKCITFHAPKRGLISIKFFGEMKLFNKTLQCTVTTTRLGGIMTHLPHDALWVHLDFEDDEQHTCRSWLAKYRSKTLWEQVMSAGWTKADHPLVLSFDEWWQRKKWG